MCGRRRTRAERERTKGRNTQKKEKKKSPEEIAKCEGGREKSGREGGKMRVEIKTSDHGIGVNGASVHVLIAT